jgi:hypothetical protein
MSGLQLEHIHQPSAKLLGQTVFQFLSNLSGATVLHLQGKNTRKCRVLVTLLHGNEPSGLKAIHQLLSQGFVPQVNTKIILASVVAARTEPVFCHRMLPGQHDLNRCFNSGNKDLQSQLASSINELITSYQPEAVVDLHNTSGSGPAFSVSTQATSKHLALAGNFTRRMMLTDIRLGSIMEQDYGCPIITVEAGGAHDSEADITALNGLRSYLTEPDLFQQKQEIEQLRYPRRLELSLNANITFAEHQQHQCDVTMRQDLEHFNFGQTAANQLLGWVSGNDLSYFKLDQNKANIDDFFRIEQGKLLTNCPLKLFMVTTRADIAKSDCLFYFVAEK